MRLIPAALWATLIFALSSRHTLPGWLEAVPSGDKVVHASVYAVLCAWLIFGLRAHSALALAVCALATSIYGITDEYHQGFVIGRSQDVYDWVADTLGGVVCSAVWYVWGPLLRARFVGWSAARRR